MTPAPHSPLVDTHCHVDLHSDDRRLIDELERSRVYTVAVTNAPSVFHHTAALAKDRKFVRPALGLHPELVATHGSEIDDFLQLLPGTRYVGEIGLDFTTTDHDLRKQQTDIFERIIRASSNAGDKILTIHSRRAASRVLDVIGTGFRGQAILHWFSGSKSELRRAAAAGLFFSINPAMALSERALSLIREMPRDQILTETDAPFAMIGKKSSTHEDLPLVIRALASVWQEDETAARDRILANFRSLVSSDVHDTD
jgi:TatD DNase family protein